MKREYQNSPIIRLPGESWDTMLRDPRISRKVTKYYLKILQGSTFICTYIFSRMRKQLRGTPWHSSIRGKL